MMKEQVLTLIKMELRNYDQFMHKKRLKYYSWARGTVSLMSFTSNVLPVLKNVQVALTDTDKGSHKAKQKELTHMETEQVSLCTSACLYVLCHAVMASSALFTEKIVTFFL